MSIREIINLYLDNKIDDGIVYSYCFGVEKWKILYVYKPNHTAFLLNMKTNFPMAFTSDKTGFYLTLNEAVFEHKKAVERQVRKLQDEIECISKVYKI